MKFHIQEKSLGRPNKWLLAISFFGALCGCTTTPSPGVPVFKDAKGLTWFSELEDWHKNGCENSSGQYDRSYCSKPVEVSSPAAIACKKIGARVPTYDDFVGLIQSFDHASDGLKLTPKGLSQLRKAFGKDDTRVWYWSSTISSKDPEMAIFFSAEGLMRKNDYEYRYIEHSVRCVR